MTYLYGVPCLSFGVFALPQSLYLQEKNKKKFRERGRKEERKKRERRDERRQRGGRREGKEKRERRENKHVSTKKVLAPWFKDLNRFDRSCHWQTYMLAGATLVMVAGDD